MREHGPIVVPLDGSQLAEGALPYAVAVARALEERIALVCVWEGNDDDLTVALPAVAAEIEAIAKEHFANYLRTIEARLYGGVPVEVHLREGHAGEEIVRVANELQARAIVIGTHGRSGISRWLYGSTASRVLREASVPVMAVGPRVLEHPKTEVAFKHIMTPLDGTPLSESAVPVGRRIASAAGARMSLVRAVPWAVQSYPYTLPDAYIPQVDDELEKGAKAYLQRKESELKDTDVRAFVVRGAVAEGLLDFEVKENVDLIVMSTHARSGIARAALGSTAERLVQGSVPVLLVRPE